MSQSGGSGSGVSSSPGLGFTGFGSPKSSSMRSVPPPSMSNSGSCGEIPGQPSGEVGGSYAELSASLRSSGDASASGSTKTEFCSRRIFSTLVTPNLERIRSRYSMPGRVSLVVPSKEAHRC